MVTDALGVSPEDADDPFLEEWARLEPLIQSAARKAMTSLRSLVPAEVLDLEIDEMAQIIRIKLWQAMQQHRIEHLAAYIQRMAHNEMLQWLRRYRPVSPLSL